MTLPTEHQDELNELKQRVAALRARFSSDAAMEVIELVGEMMDWFARLDNEISELDSRVHYLEREDGQ